MAGTARIPEFAADPAERLTGQLLHFRTSAIADQLGQGRGEKFSCPTIPVAFQLMPLPVSDAETLMKLP